MMKTIIKLLLISLLFQGCSSVKVISDIDPSEDFSQFKTFEFLGWMENSNQKLNRFDQERIEKAFLNEAEKRGMKKVEKDADIIVALYVTGQVKTQQSATTNTVGMTNSRAGMRNPGWGWGAAHTTTTFHEYQYLEGTILIEIYDVDEKKLIWMANGTKTISDNPDKRAKEIPFIVSSIMKKYPVPIKK